MATLYMLLFTVGKKPCGANFFGGGFVCNGTTKAKQKRSTENVQPHVGCTNKPGDVRGERFAIVTTVLGLHAQESKPTTPKAIFPGVAAPCGGTRSKSRVAVHMSICNPWCSGAEPHAPWGKP